LGTVLEPETSYLNSLILSNIWDAKFSEVPASRLPKFRNKHGRNDFAGGYHSFEMTICAVLCIGVLFHADGVIEPITVFAAKGVLVIMVDGTWNIADTLWLIVKRGAVLLSSLVVVVV
jgi:hypothetical protein